MSSASISMKAAINGAAPDVPVEPAAIAVRDLHKAYGRSEALRGVTFDVPYGRDTELGLISATVTDPWGATIRLTEGLNKIAGVTPFTYIDGYVVVRPLD